MKPSETEAEARQKRERADRAWLAYCSLPRGKKGESPPIRPLEESNGLSNGALTKLFKGTQPRTDTLSKIAKVLKVTTDYLVDGTGDAPRPTGPVPDREVAMGIVEAPAWQATHRVLELDPNDLYKHRAEAIATARLMRIDERAILKAREMPGFKNEQDASARTWFELIQKFERELDTEKPGDTRITSADRPPPPRGRRK